MPLDDESCNRSTENDSFVLPDVVYFRLRVLLAVCKRARRGRAKRHGQRGNAGRHIRGMADMKRVTVPVVVGIVSSIAIMILAIARARRVASFAHNADADAIRFYTAVALILACYIPLAAFAIARARWCSTFVDNADGDSIRFYTEAALIVACAIPAVAFVIVVWRVL